MIKKKNRLKYGKIIFVSSAITIFIIFAILVAIDVSAVWYDTNGCSTTRTDYMAYETGDVTLNGTTPPVNASDISSNAWTGSNCGIYSDEKANESSYAIKITGGGECPYTFNVTGTSNGTIAFDIYDSYADANCWINLGPGADSFGPIIVGAHNDDYGYINNGVGYFQVTGSYGRSTDWITTVMHWDQDIIQLSIDGVNSTDRISKSFSPTRMQIYCEATTFYLDNIRAWLGDTCPQEAGGDSAAPVCTLNDPPNVNINETLTINFLATATDDTDIVNCSIWHNESGSFALGENNSAISSGVQFNITRDFTTAGAYNWSMYCCDSLENCGLGSTNRSMTLQSAAAPSILLLDPQNLDTNTTDYSINFTANASDISGIANCSLYHNESGSFVLDPVTTGITSNQNFSLNHTFPVTTINWSVWCCDDADSASCGLASENRTLTVASTAPAVSLILPVDNDYNNTKDINFVCDATGGSFYSTPLVNLTNITLYTNTTGTWRANLTVQQNLTSTDTHFSITNINEGNGYGWNCLAYGTDENSDWGNANRTFVIDVTNATITVGSNLASNLSMSYSPFNVSDSVNCSDTNLFSFKSAVNGVLNASVTNIVGTEYNYNFSFNSSKNGLAVGVHTVEFNCSDGHTGNQIGVWKYSKDYLAKSVKYKFDDGWIKIKPTRKGLFSDFNTNRKSDRYTFEFRRDWMARFLYGDDMEFEVSSNRELFISAKTGYEGWIISDALRKWVDFETITKHGEVIVTQVSPKKILVYIADVEDDFVIFSSSGDLNKISQQYSFYYGGTTTETGGSQKIETGFNTFTLNFEKNDSQVRDIYAYLFWNNTAYTPTKTVSDEYINFTRTITNPLIEDAVNNKDFNYQWNYTIVGVETNTSDNTSLGTQTIFKMGITNCSAGNLTTLNLTVVNASGTTMNLTFNSLFFLWNDSSTQKRNVSVSHTNTSNASYCILPNFASIYGDIEVEYDDTIYDKNQFLRDSYLLDNTTDNFLLYIYSGGTTITITVVDEYDEGISGAIVEAHEFNIVTNNFTLITMEETDLDGIVKMDLNIDERHKFVVRSAGDVVYESETYYKLFQTEYTFRIVTEGQASVALQLDSLTRSITWNDSSRKITLTWNDVTNIISKIYLEVYRTNATNNTLISQQTSTSDSGTLIYALANQSGFYLGEVYVDATADGNKYFLDSVSISQLEAYDMFGTEALVVGFIFLGVIILLGLTISAEAGLIISIMGLAAFYILGFIQLTLYGLMGIIVAIVVFIIRVKRG